METCIMFLLSLQDLFTEHSLLVEMDVKQNENESII